MNDADARTFDLIIIGAGINGAAIAREAALHDLRVLVLDQGDVCSGTTAWSSRLIHGGLRYLEYAELSLVYESLGERERLLRTAPHLVEPLGLYIPIYRTGRRPRWQIRAGMMLYDLLSWRKSVPNHEMLTAEEVLRRVPGLDGRDLVGGAFYFDAQVTFPERLVVENLKDAIDRGAELATYRRVTELVIRGRQIHGVRWRDRGGDEGQASAPVVINAAGPWVDRVLGQVSSRPLVGGTKGSHLILEPFTGVPDAALYVEAESDGRPFFIIPWNGLLLIGTTDQRYTGDPGEASTSDAELRYLLGETGRVFPRVDDLAGRVLYTQAGIRSLPYRPDGKEAAITRRHIIRHHRRVRGLYSIIGGKLTTHRALAEDVMSRVAKRLGLRDTRSPTRQRSLPGGGTPEERRALLEVVETGLGSQQAERLWRIYGRMGGAVNSLVAQNPELGAEICPHTRTLAAEVVHAIESEWAVTLEDILQRRCMAGLGRDFGLAAAQAAAACLTRLSIWDRSRAEQELADYRRYAARFRVRALSPDPARRNDPGITCPRV